MQQRIWVADSEGGKRVRDPRIDSLLTESLSATSRPGRLCRSSHSLHSQDEDRFVTLGTHTEVSCWLLSTPKEAIIFASSALARRAGANDGRMKKSSKKNDSDIQAEYDFSRGVRGKYARRYAQGTNVVVLEPDVARAFPSADAVNSSLRALAQIIRKQKSAVAK